MRKLAKVATRQWLIPTSGKLPATRYRGEPILPCGRDIGLFRATTKAPKAETRVCRFAPSALSVRSPRIRKSLCPSTRRQSRIAPKDMALPRPCSTVKVDGSDTSNRRIRGSDIIVHLDVTPVAHPRKNYMVRSYIVLSTIKYNFRRELFISFREGFEHFSMR